MPEPKKTAIQWKMVALNLAGMVGDAAVLHLPGYLLLQLLNALLIAKEAVGEERAPALICLSAFLSVLLPSLFFLRRERHGRLPLCLGCAFLFMAAILIVALAFGEGLTVGRQILGLGGSAALGGILAAVAGGRQKSRRKTAKRR